MKISYDDQKAISLILIYTALLFFLIGMAAKMKMDFHFSLVAKYNNQAMRIAVTGPQNTGKSTFIEDFLSALPTYTTPERTYRDLISQEELPVNQETNEDSQRRIRDFLFDQATSNIEEDVIFDVLEAHVDSMLSDDRDLDVTQNTLS